MRVPRRLALLVALASPALAAAGCAGLIVRDSDSAGAKSGKIVARTLLVLPTLGISEIGMGNAKRRDEDRQFREALNAAVGRMTMDEAVSRWGRPTSTYDGSEVIVAEWSSRSTGAVAAPIGGMIVAVPVHHGWDLRLTFGRESKLLRQWSYGGY